MIKLEQICWRNRSLTAFQNNVHSMDVAALNKIHPGLLHLNKSLKDNIRPPPNPQNYLTV